MFLKKALLFIIFAISASLSGQELLPYVQNFTKSDYTGDNQVWSVVQGDDNAIYFANNHFFLRYNGVRWEKYSLPNKTIIRSVFADGNRIYSGSYREFGYWQRVNGVMQYTSLTAGKSLFKGEADNEEIWKIFKKGETLYFQSFNAVYVYRDNAIERIKFPAQVSYCYVIDNDIYAATVKKGLYTLQGKNFVKVKNWDIAEGNVIHGMQKSGNQIYLFTKTKGIYKGNKNKLTYWDTPINTLLKSEMVHNALFVNDTTLVVGTARAGLYIINTTTGAYKNISRNNRLNNNAVLSLTLDNEKDLWLGLDNGISHIEINSPVSVFADNSGVLGSVYAMDVMPGGGYLFASNHGVFTYDDKELNALPGATGQGWEVYKKPGTGYVIGHNDGNFAYQNNMLELGNTVNGGWRILQSNYDDAWFQSTYSGIVFYKDINNLENYMRLDATNRPFKKIAQIRPGELWAADNNRGLFHITYTPDFKVTGVENVSQYNNIEYDFGVRLFNFKNEILFYINNTWYTYNNINKKLEPDNIFNANFKNISDVIPVDDNSFMLLKDNMLYLITQSGEDFTWRFIPEKYYQGKLILEDTRVFKNKDALYLNLDDGFLTFNRQNIKKKPSSIAIEAYYENKLITDETVVKYNNSVEVDVISEYLGYDRPDLFYTINDSKEFLPVKNGYILLNNLGSGTQTIDIYNNDGQDYKKVKAYSFYVARPWYFSVWMLIVYVLVVITIFFLYYRWNKVRYMEKIKLNEEELKHRRQILELEMEAEIKLRNQEYEKHRLEMEVQNKASEVAGKSLSIAKHSEMIENIQEVLNNEGKSDQLKTKIKKIIKTSTISKNEWQNFEKNLIKSHEEFVERLTQKYPNLTPKDIKLSIYLKMNLSSKEIAPLMNISFRGVELHRYRLRKKLDIATEESLTKFMFKI